MTVSAIDPLVVPLTRLPDGTLRVTGTRIPLERIVESYKEGDSPETIVEDFDTLQLADVYAVITYYLNQTEEVEAYLRKQEADGDEMQRKIEAEMPVPKELRERILAARARMEAEKNASPGQ
jgi:uncharacterized protein (DUF433 family)